MIWLETKYIYDAHFARNVNIFRGVLSPLARRFSPLPLSTYYHMSLGQELISPAFLLQLIQILISL